MQLLLGWVCTLCGIHGLVSVASMFCCTCHGVFFAPVSWQSHKLSSLVHERRHVRQPTDMQCFDSTVG